MIFSALFFVAGCMTTTTSRGSKNDDRKPGIVVKMYKDGALELYGNPIEKRDLPKRLKADGGGKTRAVELHAQTGVWRKQLEEMRDYLVDNGIPFVVTRSEVRMQAYDKDDPEYAVEKAREEEMRKNAAVRPPVSSAPSMQRQPPSQQHRPQQPARQGARSYYQ